MSDGSELFWVLQLDWVLNYRPEWLGPLLMLLGLGLFVVGFALSYSDQDGQVWLLYGIFAAAGTTPWVLAYPTVFVAGLLMVGAWLQGVGTFRAVMKINHYASRFITYTTTSTHHATLGTEARSLLRSLTRKALWFVAFQIVSVLGVLSAGLVFAWLVVTGPLTTTTVALDLLILWTLLTAVVSILGYLWRLWGIREPLPALILLGIVLMVVGAELYNIRLLGTNLLLFLVAKVVSLAALVATASLWLAKLRAKSKPWSSSSEVMT